MNNSKTDIEKAVLGCFLIDNSIELFGLNELDFVELNHRKIFKGILNLKNKGSPIDLITLRNELEELGFFGDIGGNNYLIELINSQYTTVHQETYVKELKEHRAKNEMIKIGSDIIEYYSNTNKVNGELFNFSKRIIDVNLINSKMSFSMDDDIFKTMAYLESRKGKSMFGLSWGIPFLDTHTKGCQKGLIYRIGAPSNRGKSQLVYGFINSFLNQEIEEEDKETGEVTRRKPKIVFFTLENAKEKTMTQIMANYLGINSHSIEDGTADVNKGIDYLYGNSNNLYIVEDLYELNDIFQAIQKINPDYVFLDYIGKCRIKGFPKEKMFDEYAMSVGEFVKKTKVGWIDLSNLPKNIEENLNEGQFMGAASLRDSCDVSFHFNWFKKFYEYRDLVLQGAYDEAVNKINVIEFVVTKNRWGDVLMKTCFKIDFSKGGRIVEATKEEISKWETSF